MRLRHRTVVALAAAACLASTAEGCRSTSGAAEPDARSFSGSSSGSSSGAELACIGASDCSPGQVCCLDEASTGTACQTGPCKQPEVPSPTPPALQACTTSVECLVKGDICATWTIFPISVIPDALQVANATVCVTEAQFLEAGLILDGSADASTEVAGDAGDPEDAARGD